jgi:TRAP-type C4-dicarboxylate transport system permease small subunit
MTRVSSLLPDEPLPQRCSRILAWIAGAIILIGCGLLISIDVVTRFFFRRGMVESFEISGYALAAAIGLGMAFTVVSKSNIRVDLVLATLPVRARVVCDMLAALSLALIAGALAWHAFHTAQVSWAMGAKSVSSLQTPMAVPQGIWAVGIVWFAAMAVIISLQAAARLVAGDRAGFDALIGSLNVADEIEQAGVSAKNEGSVR